MMMITIALIAVILECFVFAIALQLAVLVLDAAPVSRRRRGRCVRCGCRFDAEPEASDSAYCGFCAVVVVYEHSERVSGLLAPDGAIVRAYN